MEQKGSDVSNVSGSVPSVKCDPPAEDSNGTEYVNSRQTDTSASRSGGSVSHQPVGICSASAGPRLSRLGSASVANPFAASTADSDGDRRSFLLTPSRLSTAGTCSMPSGRLFMRPSALNMSRAPVENSSSLSSAAAPSGADGTTPLVSSNANGTESSDKSSNIVGSGCSGGAGGFALQPPKFNNPFASVPTGVSELTSPVNSADKTIHRTGANPEYNKTPSSSVSTSNQPAVTVGADSSTVGLGGSSGANFVFGENLQDRVTNAPIATAVNSCEKSQSDVNYSAEGASTGSSGELPTNTVETADVSNNDSAGEGKMSGTVSRSLLESAEQYEKQRNVKRRYDEVAVVTGEENETNVLQVGCKLYAFESSTCQWQERGRGLLRLNDRRVVTAEEQGQDEVSSESVLQSRLVFRVQGSMRLALNAKLWAGMDVQKPSSRDVRVTAIDGDQALRVFLLKCSAKDADLLYDTLKWRLRCLQPTTGALAGSPTLFDEKVPVCDERAHGGEDHATNMPASGDGSASSDEDSHTDSPHKRLKPDSPSVSHPTDPAVDRQ